ncbi:MAG: hypothetical protein ACKO1M_01485, partial [Planctomycetota bacterium]
VVRLRHRRDALLLLGAWRRAVASSTLLVDGWERLGRPWSVLAAALVRLRGRRMVVTSHGPTGMPVAAHTAGTLTLLTTLVARLPSHEGRITGADLTVAFTRHGGNLRDSLGDLYDRYESRSRGS